MCPCIYNIYFTLEFHFMIMQERCRVNLCTFDVHACMHLLEELIMFIATIISVMFVFMVGSSPLHISVTAI